MVTRFSGLADDTDQWAIPLEKFHLVESYMDGCGGLWAEPDLDEIIWRMQDLVANREYYQARALKAAQWLRDNATYAHSAQKLMGVIGPWLGHPEAVPVTERQNGHKEVVV